MWVLQNDYSMDGDPLCISDGCYFQNSSEGSFQVHNLETCQEYCRGLDNLYASFFGSGVCKCLNKTEPEATPVGDVFCSEGSSLYTRVYNLGKLSLFY